LPKLKQKYYLWCYGGGIFHKNNDEDVDNESLASLYEDLNIQELEEGDPRINQVRNFSMTISLHSHIENSYKKCLQLFPLIEHSRKCQRRL
jgi:hypothetical protein